MTTLRTELKEAGFDFDTGMVLIQPGDGWCPDGASRLITDAELDFEFETGYGAPEMPRFVAWNSSRDTMYFPGTYDGSTWVEQLKITPDAYLGKTTPTPYVGG